MIERFEIGKKYRWIGPDKPVEMGIPKEVSEEWEKGRPHKCRANINSGTTFYGIKNGRLPWAYGGFEANFEEVTI